MVENEDQGAELPLDGVGAQLARARSAAGWTLADIAAQTRITERHLELIEAGSFAALPSRAYAIGFVRSYAKALGLDSNEVVASLREELASQEADLVRRPPPGFEPGDPARLPGRRVAWFAAAGVAVVLVAGFLVWPSLYAPGGTLPSTLPTASASTAAVAPVATPTATGPVVFTAIRDRVWVRFADGTGQQLFQDELALGESWTVPEAASGVTLTTARPDGLTVTVAGRPVPPLAQSERLIRDVPVSAAALLARGSAATESEPVQTTAAPATAPRRQVRAVRPAGPGAAAPAAPAPTPAIPGEAAPPVAAPSKAAVTEDSQA